jgi:hypothetical protein
MTKTLSISRGKRLAPAAILLAVVGLTFVFVRRSGESDSDRTLRKELRAGPPKQEPLAAELPAAPGPAAGGSSPVSMESVTLQLAELRDELRKKEKARATQIAKVDTPAFSHICFLIPPPSDAEVKDPQTRLDGILSAATGVVSPDEDQRIRAEFSDYLSCGKSKRSGTPYKVRTLGVTVKNDMEPSIVGDVTRAQDIEYGTDPKPECHGNE